MGARTLLYRLMVISPIALIIWIVGTGRFAVDTFEVSAATRKQHEAISAYRGVVKATTPLRARDYRPAPDELRRIANMWIEGFLSGRLVPLTPSFVGDTVQSGVKSEIRSCQAALTQQLLVLAGREARSGQIDQALADIRVSLLVSQILRASDPLAEAACSQEQGHAIARLREMLDRLNGDQLEQIQLELTQLKQNAPSMDKLVRQTAVLMQQSQPQLSSIEKWGTVIASAKTKGTMSIRLTDFMATKRKNTQDMPAPIAQLYLGIKARDTLNEEIDALLSEISMLLNPEQGIG